MATTTLIRTKLHRPPVPRDMVERPRLVEKLNQGLGRNLTLVSAPAGYGKSMTVSAWVETLDFPAAWLSLDAFDDDLTSFGAYVAEAVHTAYPDACQTAAPLLRASTLLPPHRLADAFLVDLEALPGPLALVLDDYHTIQSPDIHAFMKRVVSHLPSSSQLVVITRQDPPLDLPRLRARRQMLEIDEDDLSFTPEEARTLLSRLSGEVISEEIVTLLNDRTEGWPVGLQMAGISLRDSRNPSAFARRFAQTRHHQLMEYLLSEVLSELTPAERIAALQMAIADRFCAGLCEAIVMLPGGGRLDGDAFIRKLTRANLFTIALDDEGVWFRFHHLFGDLLRHRLQRTYTDEAIAQMHERASTWLAGQGQIEEALQHALAAGNAQKAAQLIEQQRHALLDREDRLTTERWFAMLPEEVVQKRPALLLTRAWSQLWRWRHASIPPILQTVAALIAHDVELPESEKRILRGEIDAINSSLWHARGDGQRCIECARRALERIPPSLGYVRGFAFTYMSLGHQMTGQGEIGIRILEEALTSELSRSDLITARVLMSMTTIYYLSGDLYMQEKVGQRLLNLCLEKHLALTSFWAYLLLGTIYYQQNRLAEAVTHLSAVTEYRYLANTRTFHDCLLGLALTYQAQGRSQEARQMADTALEFAWETYNLVHKVEALSLQARLALLQGNLKAATHWAQAVDLEDVHANILRTEIPRLTLARALIAQRTAASVQKANQVLDELLGLARAVHSRRHIIEVLALQALVYDAQGEGQKALHTLRQSLDLAQPGGFIQIFVEPGPRMARLLRQVEDPENDADYVKRILAAFQDSSSPSPPAQSRSILSPPLDLTNREMDVLELLAQRLTNKEIAAQLHISPRTVKKHTINIYQKLHTENRRQAVVKARALGILPAAD